MGVEENCMQVSVGHLKTYINISITFVTESN